MKFIHAPLLAIAVFTLSGCFTTKVYSNVTTFHDGIDTNKTFIVIPFDKQKGSLEFKQYARIISDKLATLGYKKSDNDKADIGVFIDYGIDNGQTSIDSYPIYGSTGGGTTYHSGSVNSYSGVGSYSGSSYTAPSYGIVGSGISSHTTYNRHFRMDLIDLNESADGDIVKVFEGKVSSNGSTGSFTVVGGCLIKSLFDIFPGKNSSVSHTSYPLKECNEY